MRTKNRIPLHIHGNYFEDLQTVVKKEGLKSVSWLINDIVSKANKPALKPRIRKDFTIDLANIEKLNEIAKSCFNSNLSEAINYLIAERLNN